MEQVLTAQGAILVTYFGWRDDPNGLEWDSLMRYCQYLAVRGYGAGANQIFTALGKMSDDEAVNWLKYTYGEFVTSDDDLLQFVFGL